MRIVWIYYVKKIHYLFNCWISASCTHGMFSIIVRWEFIIHMSGDGFVILFWLPEDEFLASSWKIGLNRLVLNQKIFKFQLLQSKSLLPNAKYLRCYNWGFSNNMKIMKLSQVWCARWTISTCSEDKNEGLIYSYFKIFKTAFLNVFILINWFIAAL